MSSLPPFQFATLSRTHTSAPSGAAAAAPAAGPILSWPAAALGIPAIPQPVTFPDDYELKMEDIDESDRVRFLREAAGRSYAACWPYDRELDVWRRVFFSYPDTVQMGLSPCDPRHHSTIFGRDLRQAREDIQVLLTAPAHPPALQRANAELGSS